MSKIKPQHDRKQTLSDLKNPVAQAGDKFPLFEAVTGLPAMAVHKPEPLVYTTNKGNTQQAVTMNDFGNPLWVRPKPKPQSPALTPL